MTFASTEHNIDAYFFFRDLAYLANDDQYGQVALLIKQGLLTQHWDAADQRFYQGISLDEPDSGRALDLSSWGVCSCWRWERSTGRERWRARLRIST